MIRTSATLALACAALGPLAAPVYAQQDRFELPAGCSAYVTVQEQSCTVAHHFTCDGDPEGLQRRVDLTEAGLVYIGAIDAETQWIESFHIRSGHAERLAPNPADPASLSELLDAGADTYDFVTQSDEVGSTRYVGADSLTGEVVTIDGVTLLRTDYDIRALGDDGAEQWRAKGSEYVSPDWRIFLSGTSRVSTPTDSWTTDDSPVEFIFPDEPGFLSANPKYGCGATTSSYEVTQ